MKQLSKAEAVALHDSDFWVEMTDSQIATFQVHQDRLCMPFDVFHKAIENALGRPVYTHEFGLNRKGLTKELAGEGLPPSLDDIINMIPEEQRIVIVAGAES